jgi:hypothetical protein
MLFGCRATSVIVGVTEPSISGIKLGDQRTKAEEVLGKPLWHAGLADGLAYEIYQYPVARPGKPGIAPFVLLFYPFGLGLLELTHDTTEFEQVKQIGVAYDAENRVRHVSEPWIVSDLGACRRMRSLIPVDSGIPVAAKPLLRNDQIGATSTRVRLHLINPSYATLDGRGADGPVVDVAPGRHTLRYAVCHGFKGLGPLSSKKGPCTEVVFDFELLPGRTYHLNRKDYYPPASVSWLEDIESGEVIQCSQELLYQ